MAKRKRITLNDGFNPEFANGAKFDGNFEIPRIEPLNPMIAPKRLVPFSKRNYIDNPKEAFICFFENDDFFTDVIRNPMPLIEDLSRFAGIIAPDNSLYLDSPFICQAANVYRRNVIAHLLQRSHIPVIANPRWGDERTYASDIFPEQVAFLGVPKHNIVCIGTYGCVEGDSESYYFKEGLRAMLDYIEPKIVLVYGPMPNEIFGEFLGKTQFIQYNDWAKVVHGMDPYGHEVLG